MFIHLFIFQLCLPQRSIESKRMKKKSLASQQSLRSPITANADGIVAVPVSRHCGFQLTSKTCILYNNGKTNPQIE